MNKAILMGRLTRDPEIRYSNGPEQTAVGRFTLAVDRRGQRQGNQQNADFIPCVAFGKSATRSPAVRSWRTRNYVAWITDSLTGEMMG